MKRQQRIFLNKLLAIMLAVLMALPMNTIAWAAEFSDGTQVISQENAVSEDPFSAGEAAIEEFSDQIQESMPSNDEPEIVEISTLNDEIELQAEGSGNGWEWVTEGDVTYLDIKDGKITNAELYKAFVKWFNDTEPGERGKFKYHTSNHLTTSDTWVTNGTSIESNSSELVELVNGKPYFGARGKNRLQYELKKESFTVRHYYSVTASLAEGSPEGAAVQVSNNGKIYAGDNITVTVTPVEGYSVQLFEGNTLITDTATADDGTVTYEFTAAASRSFTVTYVESSKPKHTVSLVIDGKEYGEAVLTASDEQFEGTEITLTATPKEKGYISSISIEGAEINLSDFNAARGKTGTFTVGETDVTVTVVFGQKVLEKNAEIGTVGFNENYSVSDQLGELEQNIFNAVVNASESLPSGLTWDKLTYQYRQLGKTFGTLSDPCGLTEDKTGYYAFGERGLGTTETVVLTWPGDAQYPTVSIEAEITLAEGREKANITYTKPSETVVFETEQDIIDAVKNAASTNSSNAIEAVRVTENLPTVDAGITTLSYKLSVAEDQNYLANEITVEIDVQAKDNPAEINITTTGNGSVSVGEITENGNLTKGEYEIAAVPTETGNTYSKNYVSKITVNGEEVTDLENYKLAVENNTTYEIYVEFQYVELKLNQAQAVYINKYITADRIGGLKEKVLKVAVDAYAGDAENYQVSVKGNVGSYNLDSLSDLEKAALLVVLGGSSASFTITDTRTGLYDTVTLAIADSRKTVSIAVSDVTISAKAEADLETSVEDQVKAAVVIKSKDPVTNEESGVDVSNSKISYSPSYKWPADGETETFTVTVTVNESETFAEKVSETLTLTITDTTVLYTVTYTDGTEDAKYFQNQVYEKVPENTSIPSYKVKDADGNETAGVPAHAYYNFTNWTLSEETKENVNEDGTLKGNLVYVAQWAPKLDANENGIADQEELYTVVYAAGYEDGEGNAVILGTYDNLAYGAETPIFDNDEETEGVQEPEREGYNFLGWNPTVAETVEAPSEKDSTTILYTAQWTQEWVVTFKGHTYENTVTVENGQTITEPEDAWDADHKFLGWFEKDAEEAFDFTKEITDNVTLTAKWMEDFNHNDIDDAEEEHFNVIYVVDDVETEYKDILVNMPTPSYGEEEPSKANAIFNGWDPEVAETVTADVTYTAQWLNDVNNNGVDDTEETIIINVAKANDADAVSVKGAVLTDEETKAYVFDSSNEQAEITLTAAPVVENKISKTYVDAVVVEDASEKDTEVHAAGSGSYGDKYVYTYTFVPANAQIVTVTFKEAKFDLKELREMNYYTGMKDVNNADVYNAIVNAPELTADTEYTIQYKAREAMTQSVSVESVTSNGTLIGLLKLLGYTSFDFSMPELWQDVDVETSDKLIEESVSLDAAVAMYLNEDTIGNLWDVYQAAGGITGGSAAIKAVGDEIENIYNKIYAAAMYYGAHNFGYNNTNAETVTEEIKITYKNAAMYIETETDLTLRDMRETSYVTGNNVSLVYRDYTDEELAGAIGVAVTDANGNVIDGADTYSMEITDPYTLEGKAVSDTGYEITFKFAGNDTYKPSETTFTVTIVKATAKIDLPNIEVTYGTEYDPSPEITLGNKYGETSEITESMIQFLIGLDVSELDVDGNGVTGLNSKVQLFLPKELQDMLNTISGGKLEDGMEMSLSELLKALELIDSDSLGVLKQMLEAIQGIVETSDFKIVIGGKYPEDIGAYLYGAVSTASNYETAYDVGYIVIKPDTEKVYLDWNFKDSNGVFTYELLQYADFGASAFDDEAFTQKNETATEKIQNLLFGLDANGDLVLEWNKTAGLKNGVYTQLAFVAEFGNTIYYAVPIIRAFTIIPNAVEVNIVDNEGTNFKRTFDEQPQSVDVELDYKQGTAIVPSEENLTVTYTGVQTNAATYNSTEAPTHAGAYIVTATYVEKDSEENIIAVGMDIQPMLVMPAETDVTVENAVITYDGTERKFSDYITVDTEAEADPDVTVISASIASTGDFSENGWDAVEGNVNIDFPAWIDELLKDSEAFTNGVDAKELSSLLKTYEDDILAKIEGLDLKESQTEALVSAMKATLNNLVSVLEQMPENVTLTFNDDVTFSSVGAYAVVAIVTDTDYMPAMDAGVIVVIPEVEATELKWNYEDENGIWTRDLLNEVDLKATAYEKGTENVNAEATEKITYQFVGFDTEGDLVVTNNPAELPNGVYTEMAYISLEVGGKMTISNMISRVITIVPNAAEVQFVDESGKENHDRSFDFDNTEKEMNVKVSIGGEVIEPQEGTLTVTYYGVQTNGQIYKETKAPKHAGMYAVTAEYKDYTENGSLAHYGAAVGAMVIKPAESAIEVTGGTVAYDGNGHTATVKATSKAADITPDYTLISGHVNVKGNIEEVGVDAFTANVNIDFPTWMDEILADYEFKQEGINPAYLVDFMTAHKDEIFAMIPTDILEKAGISAEDVKAEIEKVYEQMIALLKAMPQDISITFEDDIEYTEPGYYLYYGIVTDSDHKVSSDTGLLEITKLPYTLELKDTTVVYDGESHDVDVVCEKDGEAVETDRFTMIVDRETNTVNLLLEDDLTYLVEKIEELTGLDLKSGITVEELYEKIPAEELAKLIVAAIEKVEAEDIVDKDSDLYKMMEMLKDELTSLPTEGKIVIDQPSPVDAGTYEYYTLAYSEHYETQISKATLTITKREITVTIDSTAKYAEEEDPEFTYELANVVEKDEAEMDAFVKENISITREAGEEEGKTYPITATIEKEHKNYTFKVVDGELRILREGEFTVINSHDDHTDYRENLYEGNEKIVVVELNREDYYGEVDEQPILYKQPYIFAGWFTDLECDTVYTGTSGKAYAKFVNEKVLSVKNQIRIGAEEAESTGLRFVTTVDTLNYSAVGFEFTINGKKNVVKNDAVYKKLRGTVNGQILSFSPKAFCEESNYFLAFEIRNIPKASYDVNIKATPYWITLDGTKVYGISRTISVNEKIAMDKK